MNKGLIYAVASLLFLPSFLLGIFPINVFRPWDLNLRPLPWYDETMQLAGYYETGLKVRAYGSETDSGNVLQLWTPQQDALAMLQGFPANSPYTNFYTNVLMSPMDDGTRGNLVFDGHFELKSSAGIGFYYHFPHYVTLIVGLPIYSMSLNHVIFRDLTQTNNAADLRVKNSLTNNFLANIASFDPSLNLNGWSRTGVGDLGIMAEWRQGFKQSKPVCTQCRASAPLRINHPYGPSNQYKPNFVGSL